MRIIGLVTLLACKAMGATEIYIIDIINNRLETAKKLGATQVINAKEIDTVKKINELTDEEGVDIVIETAEAKLPLNKQFPL